MTHNRSPKSFFEQLLMLEVNQLKADTNLNHSSSRASSFVDRMGASSDAEAITSSPSCHCYQHAQSTKQGTTANYGQATAQSSDQTSSARAWVD